MSTAPTSTPAQLPNGSAQASPAASRGRAWPWAIAAVLVATMGVNFWVMKLAAADPSVVVEADYYRKAVAYDAELAQDRINATLGWRIAPALAPTPDGRTGDLHVTLRDAGGAPIVGATVQVDAFSILRSATVERRTLAADGAGYRARFPLTASGQWELRFTATRGADRFTQVVRVDVPAVVAQR